MNVTTRGVLAILIVLLMTLAMVASRRERGSLAAWLLTAGFAVAAGWAGLGVLWTHEYGPEGSMTPQLYATLVMTAVAFALFFGVRAKDGEKAFDG